MRGAPPYRTPLRTLPRSPDERRDYWKRQRLTKMDVHTWLQARLREYDSGTYSWDRLRGALPDRRHHELQLLTQHYPMLRRNLVYTGVTRGKRLVVLVGQRRAVSIAVRGVAGRKRWSKLREWLAAGDSPFEPFARMWAGQRGPAPG